MARIEIENTLDKIAPELRSTVFHHLTATWWDNNLMSSINLYDKSLDDLLKMMIDMGYRDPKWYQFFKKPARIRVYNKD